MASLGFLRQTVILRDRLLYPSFTKIIKKSFFCTALTFCFKISFKKSLNTLVCNITFDKTLTSFDGNGREFH